MKIDREEIQIRIHFIYRNARAGEGVRWIF